MGFIKETRRDEIDKNRGFGAEQILDYYLIR
jgi:hypothetical protein